VPHERRSPARTRSFSLPLRGPFELRLALFGHGFVDLAPHAWSAEARRFTTALELRGKPFDLSLVQRGKRLEAHLASRRAPGPLELAGARRAIERMLRLDEDFRPFWGLCRGVPRLGWAARRGAGRMLRSPTLFEDLVKLLFTTNCSWAATRGMTARLVTNLGVEAPSGARAFPDAARVAERRESFFRDVIRAGYRAAYLRELARGFARGELHDADFEDPSVSTEEVRRRLRDLPGFGPYAAGQALRLLGRYDDLALDSWCVGRLSALRGRAPSEKTLLREYRPFAEYAGLALWLDLTAEWHGEGPTPAASPLVKP
jgi:3-methyladenine DNA glycosylase/8-oxoguanine DNA glycosylase